MEMRERAWKGKDMEEQMHVAVLGSSGQSGPFRQHRLRGHVGRKEGRQEGDTTGQDNWRRNETAFNPTSKIMKSF